MTTTVACRRGHTRHRFLPDAGAQVTFPYPGPLGERFAMPLNDLSASGVAFTLTMELPALEPGRTIGPALLEFGEHRIRADLLVMHLTPDAGSGSVCGALLYPSRDRDLRTLQAFFESLG